MAKRTTHRTDATETGEVLPEATTEIPVEGLPEPASDGPAEAEPVVAATEPEPEVIPEPEPVVPPEPETVRAEPPATPQVIHRGPGAGALILGGVVAALIGSGATLYAVPHLPPQLSGWISAPKPDTSATESALAAQGSRIEALSATVDGLKSAPAPTGDTSGLQSALDANAAEMRGIQEALKTLTDRVATLESRPVATVEGGAPDTAVSALQSQIDTLRSQLAGAGNMQEVQTQIAAAAAQVKSQLESVQGQASQIGTAAEAAAQRSLQQAAAARVAASLQAGAPLAPALADAEAAGLTVPDALKADVPSLSALQSAFPEAARAALTASRKAAAGAGFGERIGAFLMAQTGARSLNPREGTDPDAVMSRAQAAVDDGDLPRALQEIGALPQAGQALMSGWITRAQLRIAANQAVTDLAQSVK